MDVDRAYDLFKNLVLSDFQCDGNEAEVRHKLIDPILERVLGWPKNCIEVERKAGTGTLDYLLFDFNKVNWFVIEAKNNDVKIAHAVGHRRVYNLTGPVLKNTCLPIIENQMSEYLGRHMPAYGIVSNGEQWVCFLAKLRPAGIDLQQSKAIVFSSLEDIDKGFNDFFSFFSYENVANRKLFSRLGQNSLGFVPYDTYRLLADFETKPYYKQNESFYTSLSEALNAAFRPIQKDEFALEKCFVETTESKRTAERLERLVHEMSENLKDAAENMANDIEEEVHNLKVPNYPLQDGTGCFVRLIGEPSSGKTTFLRRLFKIKLSNMSKLFCPIWIDCSKIVPDNATQLSLDASQQLLSYLFDDSSPNFEQLKQIYHVEWRQYRKLYGVGNKPTKNDKKEFYSHIGHLRKHPDEELKRLCKYAAINRKILPIFIIDNIDHLADYLTPINWAVSIYNQTYSAVVISIKDTTFWELKKQRNDKISECMPQQYWLYRPRISEVIENRCDYLSTVIETSKKKSPLIKASIGLNRQYSWNVDPDKLARTVTNILLGNPIVANWIGCIANNEIRDVLKLCKQIILSPHVKTTKIFYAVTTEDVKLNWVVKALISPRSEVYSPQESSMINIFSFSFIEKHQWAPLLPFRLLTVLKEKEEKDRNNKQTVAGFLSTRFIQELFKDGLAYPEDITLACLEFLRANRLLENYNPGRKELGANARLKITAKGSLHLKWATKELNYIKMMAEADNIVDSGHYTNLKRIRDKMVESFGNNSMQLANISMKNLAENYIAYIFDIAKNTCPFNDNCELASIKFKEQTLLRDWNVDKTSVAV